MERKTPQEKKQLSYLRDRRNNYGENEKSSRKSIRRNKRACNSANRRRERLVLSEIEGRSTSVGAEQVEERLTAKRPKSWRKFPDAPLGRIVVGSLELRARSGMAHTVPTAEKVEQIRRRLAGTAWIAGDDVHTRRLMQASD